MEMTIDRPAAAVAAPIRVLIAEDHRITLWGLQRLIDAPGGRTTVVGTASSLDGLLTHDALAQADVILLDLDLGGHDSSASFGALRQRSHARVLVLTADDDPQQQRAAMVKGARGLMHKSEPAETILTAIEKVHQGQIWLKESLLGEVFGMLTGSTPPAPRDERADRLATLTPREREIVELMVQNAGAKLFSVADMLGMSEHTLRNHLTAIYAKLRVRGRLELHVFATAHAPAATLRARAA